MSKMNNAEMQTLRPGFLVSMKTSVRGNVQYNKREIEVEHLDDEGKAIAEWETTRIINDPAEFKKAAEARGRAQSIIRSVCVQSAFGLLCPEGDKAELDQAIADAHQVVNAFNAQSSLTRIGVYVMVGHIAADDVEAVKSINSEVSDLLGRMEEGMKNLDVKTIRDAANRAKQVGAMLTPEASVRIQFAIDAARDAARKVVKAGETASLEIDARSIRKVTEARTAFLDMDDANEVAAPRHQGVAIDMAPEKPAKKSKAKSKQIEIEI